MTWKEKAARHPGVLAAFVEERNYIIELKPGWTADPGDAHDIYEESARTALAKLRGVERCECDDCALPRGKAATL